MKLKHIVYALSTALILSCDVDNGPYNSAAKYGLHVDQARQERIARERRQEIARQAFEQDAKLGTVCGNILSVDDWQELQGKASGNGKIDGSAFLFGGFGGASVHGAYNNSATLNQPTYAAVGLETEHGILGLKIQSDSVPVEALMANVNATMKKYGTAKLCFPAGRMTVDDKQYISLNETRVTSDVQYALKGASRIRVSR